MHSWPSTVTREQIPSSSKDDATSASIPRAELPHSGGPWQGSPLRSYDHHRWTFLSGGGQAGTGGESPVRGVPHGRMGRHLDELHHRLVKVQAEKETLFGHLDTLKLSSTHKVPSELPPVQLHRSLSVGEDVPCYSYGLRFFDDETVERLISKRPSNKSSSLVRSRKGNIRKSAMHGSGRPPIDEEFVGDFSELLTDLRAAGILEAPDESLLLQVRGMPFGRSSSLRSSRPAQRRGHGMKPRVSGHLPTSSRSPKVEAAYAPAVTPSTSRPERPLALADPGRPASVAAPAPHLEKHSPSPPKAPEEALGPSAKPPSLGVDHGRFEPETIGAPGKGALAEASGKKWTSPAPEDWRRLVAQEREENGRRAHLRAVAHALQQRVPFARQVQLHRSSTWWALEGPGEGPPSTASASGQSSPGSNHEEPHALYLRSAPQLPISRILNCQAGELTLRHYDLGTKGSDSLGEALRTLPSKSWRKLDLARASVVVSDSLCDGLAQCPVLEALDLEGNALLPHGGLALARVLAAGHLRSLKAINLSHNDIRDDGLKALCEALCATCAGPLTRLGLRGNGCGTQGARAVGTLLRAGLVVCLDLAWNSIDAGGVKHLANAAGAAGRSGARVLTDLDLSWNMLHEAGGLEAASLLSRCPGLTSLNLGTNRLGPKTAHVLSLALVRSAAALTNLDLSSNPIGSDGVLALVGSLDSCRLRSLGLHAVGANADRHMKLRSIQHFNRKAPHGKYVLNLGDAYERWIAIQIRELAVKDPDAVLTALYDDGEDVHFSRNKSFYLDCDVLAWQEVPAHGHLEVEYGRRAGSLEPPSLVHYTLDLSQPHDRMVAEQLWTRALAEPGENFLNETLDGRALHLEESVSAATWRVPNKGILDLDYATYALRFEQRYSLNLDLGADRAKLQHLIERCRSEGSSESFVNPQLDGQPVHLRTHAPPQRGLLTFDFVCRHPQHLATHHFSLDLSAPGDWLLGERLREWALSEPGENWLNETLDGNPIHLAEEGGTAELVIRRTVLDRQGEVSQDNLHPAAIRREKTLPKRGRLELDYVVLRPRRGTTVSTTQHRLDLSCEDDRIVAEGLKQRAAELIGEQWVGEKINNVAVQLAVRSGDGRIPLPRAALR